MPSATTSMCGHAPHAEARERFPKEKWKVVFTRWALHFLYYNFIRIHKTLKVTPAMAAGVTGILWEIAAW